MTKQRKTLPAQELAIEFFAQYPAAKFGAKHMIRTAGGYTAMRAWLQSRGVYARWLITDEDVVYVMTCVSSAANRVRKHEHRYGRTWPRK